MMNNVNDRFKFISKCVSLRKDMKFQYWVQIPGEEQRVPCKTHFTFKELQEKGYVNKSFNIFDKNEQFLRYSIETNDLTEVRIDLDLKDVKGRKSLRQSIRAGLKVAGILRRNNIKSSFYYSGGIGIHIHFLMNIKRFGSIPIDKRKDFKKQLIAFLGFLDMCDESSLSPNVLLTCEGYMKRNSLNNYKKIYIDKLEHNKTNYVKQFIKENKFKVVINDNFFEEVSEAPQGFTYDINQRLPLQYKKPSRIGRPIGSIKEKTNIDEKKIYYWIKTFSKLYNNKNIDSKHFFPLMVCKFLNSEGLRFQDKLSWMKFFIEKVGLQDRLSKSEITSLIKSSEMLKDERIFIYCNPQSEKFYFTFDEWIKELNKISGVVNNRF